MGLSVSKAAIGATTDERAEPESKHLADLTQYINETNWSVKRLADVLFEKTGNESWVVVFKTLITVHHLMVYGNERFIRHLASRHSLFTLHNFLDRSFLDGNTMSVFIRQYSRYLNEKSLAYRLITSDITKSKRGANGMMRTMDTKDLLNILPVIQTQFDALLKFDANPDEITNDIIHAAFRLLFKDCIRLFAAYNEGILNLLDKYFDMKRNQCRESLEIYLQFLKRTNKLARFLKVAEDVGIRQNGIPNLAQAPNGFIEALKQHLASLEGKNDILLSNSVPHPPGELLRVRRALIPSTSNEPFVNASSETGLFAAGHYTLTGTRLLIVSHILGDHVSAMLPDFVDTNPGCAAVGARWQNKTTIADNLDSSITSHIGNFNFGQVPVNRFNVKWSQAPEMEMMNGMNWELTTCTCTSTIWSSISVPPIPCLVTSSEACSRDSTENARVCEMTQSLQKYQSKMIQIKR